MNKLEKVRSANLPEAVLLNSSEEKRKTEKKNDWHWARNKGHKFQRQCRGTFNGKVSSFLRVSMLYSRYGGKFTKTEERGFLLLFVKKFKVQCKMTGRPSDVVPKIRPQTFYSYSVRRILRAHERASARTSAKWSKRTINPPRFLSYTPARTESFNEEKKEGMWVSHSPHVLTVNKSPAVFFFHTVRALDVLKRSVKRKRGSVSRLFQEKLRQHSWILASGVFTNFLVFRLFIRWRALLLLLSDFHTGHCHFNALS